jgi:(p)ppGpp synthase/HD superfamily hydrolase
VVGVPGSGPYIAGPPATITHYELRIGSDYSTTVEQFLHPGGRNSLLDLAIETAARAHAGQVRKGTDIPYISHPYAVGMMLARAGASEEVIAAGILHDTVEDTYLTLDWIRDNFGEKVAMIVEGCSEPGHGSEPWEARKAHTLEYLRAAPWEVRLVACADKLHNVRAIAAAREAIGEDVWTRFKRGRAQQEWYYRGLVDSLCGQPVDGKEIPFCAEFRDEVEKLFSVKQTRET